MQLLIFALAGIALIVSESLIGGILLGNYEVKKQKKEKEERDKHDNGSENC